MLINDKDEQTDVLQKYRAIWAGVRVQHKPQYLDRDESRTDEVGPVAQELVNYQALILARGTLIRGRVDAWIRS